MSKIHTDGHEPQRDREDDDQPSSVVDRVAPRYLQCETMLVTVSPARRVPEIRTRMASPIDVCATKSTVFMMLTQ